ncbi:acyl-CoA--6-aminopenicillanic acid acyltransferase [Bacillus ginsengihumi]|uniref:Acyl-CoA--6-aminopenicillanic acid acyltransferase n=1 Tax=Heyndrickxia ginsengihumi TaxID=363870 RepID=A0A0A6Y3K7_9BACI|nr:C45 family peptidase [Heyndrickxia ginsengihumi]KHD86817.1 choloylglycine hydrolase [Heyndrickxia ginsengihumi]MBE6183717.1 acyl-CoA--6-aminopenicillanic acid acyltransferase [Bacillus sp. (in: firmicutes)]MCM3021807.1 C45 family autoproteolytic acyltransferase/hydrolase [Heyndrickxia ginsengihumi]NEY19740.1 acyl-CoA--6-aminopenicillanic acid acyltransferase [Heyndrickxia ginsengihumi]
MRQIYSDIIQFRGTHYDFGYMQGQRLLNSLSVKNREQQWRVRKPRFLISTDETCRAIMKFAPGVWEELEGLQAALKWPIELILKEFGGYRLDYGRSGCSILTGDNFLIRNYDYHPKTYEGRYVLFQPSDQGYAIVGPTQRVTGRMDGMNEKGLAIGYNFMNRKQPGDGFICCMIGRLILEACADVEEAVAMLKEIPHRHSFSYVVYDQQSTTYIVETTPRGVEVRQGNACTNHFEIMKHENRHHLEDSKRRLSILQTRQHTIQQAYDAFRLFNDTDKGIFSTLYGSWAGTIHTSAYLPQQLEVWFALGGNQEPIRVDFAKWLKGQNVSLKKMVGVVDTDISFLHMDEDADWTKRH